MSPVRTYSLLRENEDWSFLQGPIASPGFLGSDQVHSSGRGRIGISRSAARSREAFERVGNDNWGKQPYIKAFFLERYMLHTDWHLGRLVRVFVQMKSGLESFRQGGPRPIDEKKTGLRSGVRRSRGRRKERTGVVLQAGRQELNYGSGRLVSVREGPTVRQSFDGVKIRRQGRRMATSTRSPHVRTWTSRDSSTTYPDHRDCVLGSLCHAAVAAGHFFRQLITWVRIVKMRHSIAEPPQRLGTAWQCDSGDRSRRRSPAWISTTRPSSNLEASGRQPFVPGLSHQITGTVFLALPLKPRFSVKADISSGDDPRSHTLGTF